MATGRAKGRGGVAPGWFAAIALVCLLAAPASAETYLVSTGAPPNHPWGWGARLWADLVAERSGGRIVFDVRPDLVQAGPEGRGELALLAAGGIDAAVGSALVWSGELPELGLFGLPCLIDGPGDLETLLASPTGVALLQDLRRAGVEPLAWGDAGAWAVAARSGPLVTSARLAGLSLRVPDWPAQRDAMMALGVDPVAADLRRGLLLARLGALDGVLARLADLASSARPPQGFDTWTVWPCIAEPLVFAVGAGTWRGWSLADRALVAQAAVEAAVASARMARDLVRQDAPWLAAGGLTLIRFTPDEVGRLATELSWVRQRWAASVGPDRVLAAEQLLLAPR